MLVSQTAVCMLVENTPVRVTTVDHPYDAVVIEGNSVGLANSEANTRSPTNMWVASLSVEATMSEVALFRRGSGPFAGLNRSDTELDTGQKMGCTWPRFSAAPESCQQSYVASPKGQNATQIKHIEIV